MQWNDPKYAHIKKRVYLIQDQLLVKGMDIQDVHRIFNVQGIHNVLSYYNVDGVQKYAMKQNDWLQNN